MYNPENYAYKKLDGKRATHLQFAQKVANLSMGDMKKGNSPMLQKDIMNTLGFKDKKSIQKYMNIAKELNLFDKTKKDDFKIKQFSQSKENKDFVSKHPTVSAWVEDMKHRGKTGGALKSLNTRITKLRNVCNTLEIDPLQFISGANRTEILLQFEVYFASFEYIYMDKKAKIKYAKNWTKERVQIKTTIYSYTQSVLNYMSFHGFQFPKGKKGIADQSVSTFHGKYDDVNISFFEYRSAQNYIIQKWGLDSDIFRWFSVGTEAFPRASAILTMPSYYKPFIENGIEYFEMECFETKTDYYKNGIWKKMIYSENTKKSVQLVSKRCEFVIEDRSIKNRKDIYDKLREVYRFLHKEKLHCRIRGDVSTAYFMTHPSHVLRHIGAQLLLGVTDWNVAFVSTYGWKTPTELTNSYGAMPTEMKMKILGSIVMPP